MSGNGDGLKSTESLEFRLCYCKRRWRTEDFRNKQTRKHCGKQQKHDQQQQKKTTTKWWVVGQQHVAL